jgi:hypothetical protein
MQLESDCRNDFEHQEGGDDEWEERDPNIRQPEET